jgi:uncharacterized protein
MILVVHVKPNARVSKLIKSNDDGSVTIALAAPATEGKANEELIDFLSEKLGIAKSLIEIRRGHTSRTKHVEIPGYTSLASPKN